MPHTLRTAALAACVLACTALAACASTDLDNPAGGSITQPAVDSQTVASQLDIDLTAAAGQASPLADGRGDAIASTLTAAGYVKVTLGDQLQPSSITGPVWGYEQGTVVIMRPYATGVCVALLQLRPGPLVAESAACKELSDLENQAATEEGDVTGAPSGATRVTSALRDATALYMIGPGPVALSYENADPASIDAALKQAFTERGFTVGNDVTVIEPGRAYEIQWQDASGSCRATLTVPASGTLDFRTLTPDVACQ